MTHLFFYFGNLPLCTVIEGQTMSIFSQLHLRELLKDFFRIVSDSLFDFLANVDIKTIRTTY